MISHCAHCGHPTDTVHRIVPNELSRTSQFTPTTSSVTSIPHRCTSQDRNGILTAHGTREQDSATTSMDEERQRVDEYHGDASQVQDVDWS